MFQVLLVGSMFQGLAECHRFRYVCESQGVLYGQAMMESGIQAVMENGIQTSGRGAWVTDGQYVYVIAYHRFRSVVQFWCVYWESGCMGVIGPSV